MSYILLDNVGRHRVYYRPRLNVRYRVTCILPHPNLSMVIGWRGMKSVERMGMYKEERGLPIIIL